MLPNSKETRFLEWGHQEAFFPSREIIPFFPAIDRRHLMKQESFGFLTGESDASQEGEKASPLGVPGTHSPGWSAGSYAAGHRDFWARRQWSRNRRRRCSAVAPLFWSAGQPLMAVYYVVWASLACSRSCPGLLWADSRGCTHFPGLLWHCPTNLKPREIYFLAVLDVRSLKSRGQLGSALSEGCRGGSFLAFPSFWCCPAMLGTPWLGAAFLRSLLLASPGVCPSDITWLSYKVTSPWI